MDLGQDMDDKELVLQRSRAGLLTPSISDIGGWVILCCEAVLSIGRSIPGLCPQAASSTHPPKLRQPKMSPDIVKYCLGGQSI